MPHRSAPLRLIFILAVITFLVSGGGAIISIRIKSEQTWLNKINALYDAKKHISQDERFDSRAKEARLELIQRRIDFGFTQLENCDKGTGPFSVKLLLSFAASIPAVFILAYYILIFTSSMFSSFNASSCTSAFAVVGSIVFLFFLFGINFPALFTEWWSIQWARIRCEKKQTQEPS